MATIRRYHLHAVDSQPLPVTLRYDASECLVTGGTLAIHEEMSSIGDGRVEWELFGDIGGVPGPNSAGAIFWLGEEFDRLDARHLTFPGGFRKQQLTPELVATQDADALDLTPTRPAGSPGVVERLFGARTWAFVAADAIGARTGVAAG